MVAPRYGSEWNYRSKVMIPSGTRSVTGGPLTDVELAAWRGMLRASVRLRRVLGERLAERHELSMADYDLLVCLADRPDRRMRMSELAEEILQPRSSLTRIADGLERRGLIRRERSSTDGRGAEAILTPDGLRTFRRAQRTHHDNIRELFLNRLDDKHLACLAEAWAAIATPAVPREDR
jgi:DNA-binding MarR family transcriptional regulator